jgi:myo-inositol-1(or 4)-monophosphatase
VIKKEKNKRIVMTKNWQDSDWLALLDPIVRKAGELLLSYYGTDLELTEKKDRSFATPADLTSENYLKQALWGLLPEAKILAEESGVGEPGVGRGDYCWVIDPLDGTNNFARNISYFCVSVALTYKSKPVVGIIFDPVHDELFFAQQGRGAICNGKIMHVSNPEDSGTGSNIISGKLIALGLPHDRVARIPLARLADQLAYQAAGIRYMGSAALDLAYVACGRFDGAALNAYYWWDVAAGILLVQEAGGMVTGVKTGTRTGLEVEPENQFCLAGGRGVQAALQDLVQDTVKNMAKKMD